MTKSSDRIVFTSFCQILIAAFALTKLCPKNSEYDQEIPQLQTADKPTAQRGRATQQS